MVDEVEEKVTEVELALFITLAKIDSPEGREAAALLQELEGKSGTAN